MKRFIRQLQVPALILAAMMMIWLPSVQAADDIQVPSNIADEIKTAHSNADSQAQNEAILAMVNWLNENTDLSCEEKRAFLRNWFMENLDMAAEEAKELALLSMVNWLNENPDLSYEQKQALLKNWIMENLCMAAEEAEEQAFLYFPVIDLEEEREREDFQNPERPLTQDERDPSPGIN